MLDAGSAIIGAAIALVTLAVNKWFDERRLKSEESRWYAQHFLPRKVDALSNLYASLVDCEESLLRCKGTPPRRMEDIVRDTLSRQMEFLRARALAFVYLGSRGKEVLGSFCEAMTQVTNSLIANLPEEEMPSHIKEIFAPPGTRPDWERLSKAHVQAVTYFEEVLNTALPQSVQKAS